jgi:Ion channel
MPIALIAIAMDLGSWVLPVAEAWAQGASLLSLLLLLGIVLAQTLRRGPITFHRIQGAVAAYLLLGVIWAHAYSLLAILRPGAFSGPVDTADGPRALLYFSFVTLTTVGYGDVLPVHPVARSLAVLEAVVGPLYLAILVARLVSLAVAPGR